MKMTATKKRLLSGMLAGAVLLAGTISYAGAAAAQDSGQANARMERRDNMRPGQMPQLDASKIAKHVAEQFGVKESEVLAALNDKRNFRDIAYTAILAKISGKSFSDVLAMKTKDNHWRDVQKSLGVTKEQMRAEQIEMTAAHLALSGDLTRAQAKEMLQNGYRPMDIAMAARIAKEKNEDIQIVLDSKKLNNTWWDVAKEFGVDVSKLRPANRGGFGDGPMGGHPGMMNGDMMGGPGSEGAPMGEPGFDGER